MCPNSSLLVCLQHFFLSFAVLLEFFFDKFVYFCLFYIYTLISSDDFYLYHRGGWVIYNILLYIVPGYRREIYMLRKPMIIALMLVAAIEID